MIGTLRLFLALPKYATAKIMTATEIYLPTKLMQTVTSILFATETVKTQIL